jgi:hypothetical protein
LLTALDTVKPKISIYLKFLAFEQIPTIFVEEHNTHGSIPNDLAQE